MHADLRVSLRVAAVLVGLLVLPVFTPRLRANSAVGVDTSLGNSLSTPTQRSEPLDPDWVKVNHTPTGQLFSYPPAWPKAEDLKAGSGWEFSGQLEFGFISGDADDRNAEYRMYQDADNGAYLNNFNFHFKQPATARFIDVSGGSAGRHDQFYALQFGRYNDWKIRVFYNETPHVFTDQYKSLWSGVGTGNLTLLPGLTPGGSGSTATDNANVMAQALNNPDTTLGLVRKKAGIRADLHLTNTWLAYVSYTHEDRTGARPFGAVWGDINSNGTAPIELPEPINDTTHEFLAGLTHTDDVNTFNLRLSDSIYRNHIDTLTFEEPYRIPPPQGVATVPAAGAFTQGRFDLTPSNQAYNARAEYTRSLPDFYRGYFTAVVSAGKWSQDDSLIPYTLVPVTLANVTLLPGGDWNTTGSLSRKTAGAAMDTRLADLTLSLNPTADFNFKLKARAYEVANETDPFLAVNPNAIYTDADGTTPDNQSRGLTFNGVTGVWGRLLNDGTGQNILMGANTTPLGNIPISSQYYGSKQYRIGATGEYTLSKASSLNGSIERELTAQENRVRDRTWEDKLKVGYVNRGLGGTTLRLSYEYDQRRGSDYNISTYDEAFSSALVPMPTAPGATVTSWVVRNDSGLMTLDLADRNQHIANLRLDTMVSSTFNAGVSLQAREASYPASTYGRTRQDQGSANLDLNYQPSPGQIFYGFYSYQIGKIDQASNDAAYPVITIGMLTPLGTITPDNAIAIASAPGGPEFPLAKAYSVSSRDENHVVGFGVKQEIGKASLNLDYTYSIGRTKIGYAYTVGGAISAANAVFAGSGLPDQTVEINYLDASLRYPLSARVSARLVYRYQHETIHDWHYQNLENNPVVGSPNSLPTAVILDGGPDNYNANWFGVMIQITL
jgi:hypothetical protein